jgi:hypothetical protein
LHFNKVNKHFTLKNLDKRVSTLKSLPPKKIVIKEKESSASVSSPAVKEELLS